MIAPNVAAAAGDRSTRLIFELRTYRFASAEKQKAYAQFLAAAGVAAFNRAGRSRSASLNCWPRTIPN